MGDLNHYLTVNIGELSSKYFLIELINMDDLLLAALMGDDSDYSDDDSVARALLPRTARQMESALERLRCNEELPIDPHARIQLAGC